MDFKTAVKSGLENFINFEGRASRSEYWWFYLFCIILYVIAALLDGALGTTFISMVVSLGLLAPSLSAGTRRLHDINKSGWFQLLYFIPLLGLIAMIYFLVQKGDAGENRFGAPRE